MANGRRNWRTVVANIVSSYGCSGGHRDPVLVCKSHRCVTVGLACLDIWFDLSRILWLATQKCRMESERWRPCKRILRMCAVVYTPQDRHKGLCCLVDSSC